MTTKWLHRHRRQRARATLAGIAAVSAVALSACGSGGAQADNSLNSGDWASVLAKANGQTVNWYMYGGDETLNSFIASEVRGELKKSGVKLNQVKIDDTADAINKVIGEKQAGRKSGGSVDAIWINGENFATGVQADLWYCGWPQDLPNAKYVDFDAPAVKSDFGVPVDRCETPWQQANSALVYNSKALSSSDVTSISSLTTWAQKNPGKFTYPAPPDFTGSMAVRSFLYGAVESPSTLAGAFSESKYKPAAALLWSKLNELEPSLWRGGETYPQSQDAVEKLYGDGEISAYFTYGPGAVADKVRKGLYPKSTREAVLDGGNITNFSFIAIPDNAKHKAAALVLANVLQKPDIQLGLYKAEGVFPGIDITKTSATIQSKFANVPTSPSVLPPSDLTRDAQPELASTYIARFEKDWISNVLQK